MEANDDFKIFDIDQNRLDREWLNQVKLYHEYATKLAEARAELERAKAEREVVTAELDKAIRTNPQKFGMEKVTEPSIEKTIFLQKAHKRATRLYINAKHTVDVLQAKVETLDHRKKALENLVQLFLANYFSKPMTPKGVTRDELDDVVRPRKKRVV